MSVKPKQKVCPPTEEQSADRINFLNRHGRVTCPKKANHDSYYGISAVCKDPHRYICECGCQFLWKSKDEWRIMFNRNTSASLSSSDKDFLTDAGLINYRTKEAPPGKIEVVDKQDLSGYAEFDKRLIQLTKDLKTKVDEAKSRIAEHVDERHRDDDIYKFLAHTTRGRWLCGLFGYKTKRMREIKTNKKIRKLNRKRKQIIEV